MPCTCIPHMATHQDTDQILMSVKDLYFQKEKNHQHVEKLGLMHVKVEETLILVLMLTCVKHTLQEIVLQPNLLIPTNRHLHSSNQDKLSLKPAMSISFRQLLESEVSHAQSLLKFSDLLISEL